MTIKVIVFDLGDVITELDFSNFYNKIISLSPLNKPQTPIMMEFFRQSDLYHQGMMNKEEFYELGCDLLKVCELTITEFYDAFNSIISGFNLEMIEVLKKLKSLKKYKLVLLSNINASHWDYILKKKQNFIEYFDEIILSHEIHLTKPDPKIFKYTIEKMKCKPEEILFIDDGLNNIRSAKELGIIGIHYNGIEELFEELKNFGINL